MEKLASQNLSVAQGDYRELTQKLFRKIHNILIAEVNKQDHLSDRERGTLFFDTLYNTLMFSLVRSGTPKENVYNTIDWFYEQYGKLPSQEDPQSLN